MNNAYVIVTDMHIINKILVKNRVDYKKELEHVENNLLRVIKKYTRDGFNVNLIFLGDIYHRGYSDPIASIKDNNFLIYLSTVVNKIYSVIGNHELSYYKNNPFYTLFNHIESRRVKNVSSRVINPLGIIHVIDVVDTLEDGEVLFNFNHYGCGMGAPEKDRVNIGLFHQELVCKEILDDVKNKFNMDIFTNDILNLNSKNVFSGYDYCFLGHMHKVYGTYEIQSKEGEKPTRLYYLASLGRTNHSEIQDNFLDRNFPVIIVNDGKFKRIEDNTFKLLDRESCIFESIVEEQHEKREELKEYKKIKEYRAFSDDPVKNILEQISLDRDLTNIFMQLRNADIDNIGSEIRRKIDVLERGGQTWI